MLSCTATIPSALIVGRRARQLMGMLLAVVAIGTALAETSPPSRVGRVGFIEGEVSFFADREEGWRKARLNYPVTTKNSIWSNGPGRAEIRVGASAVRIDADSMLDFVTLDESLTELFLQRGRLSIRLRGDDSNNGERETFRVKTNEGVIGLDANGRYRIDAAADRNETRITVFSGRARFDSGSAQIAVDVGRTLFIRGSATSSFTFETTSETSFDRWAQARDQRWDETHQRYATERLISPNMTGYEDLDANGEWIDDREYGRLWTPRVVVGWVPYRYGAWSYVQPWGWTWIDDAPWGFAPFHYGRWVQLRARWYWWPGGYRHRPVYAPALVGWHGSGNWNVSVGVGTPIGWFPLAPREHYVPTYSNNVTYIRNINNVTNNIMVINPPNRYVNQTAGTTVVNNRVVVNGEPVWRHASIGSGTTRQVKPAVDPHSLPGTGQPTWVVGEPPAPPPRTTPSAPKPTAVVGEPVRTPSWIGGEAPRGIVSTPGSAGTGSGAAIVRSATTPITAPTAPIATQTPTVPGEPLPMAKPTKLNPRVSPAPAPAASPIPTNVAPRADGQPSVVTTKPGVLREPAPTGSTSERGERVEKGGAARAPSKEPKENKPRNQSNATEEPKANAGGGKVGHQRVEERSPKTAPQ